MAVTAVAPARTTHGVSSRVSDTSMSRVAWEIYQTSGLAGFFGGVQTSMAGQALIKAVMGLNICKFMVIQPGPAELLVIQLEAQRPDDVQPGPGIGT